MIKFDLVCENGHIFEIYSQCKIGLEFYPVFFNVISKV